MKQSQDPQHQYVVSHGDDWVFKVTSSECPGSVRMHSSVVFHISTSQPIDHADAPCSAVRRLYYPDPVTLKVRRMLRLWSDTVCNRD